MKSVIADWMKSVDELIVHLKDKALTAPSMEQLNRLRGEVNGLLKAKEMIREHIAATKEGDDDNA